MITEKLWKNRRAVQLENDEVRAVILPELGGKIASFCLKKTDFELLFQNCGEYKRPELYSQFADFDASGFDDAFPCIDSETIHIEGREIKYPDHGEVWTMPLDYEISGGTVVLSGKSRILPYSYQKEINIERNKMTVKYAIGNTGSYPFPYIWTMHCLIRCTEDMRISLPEETKFVENVMESRHLGPAGTIHAYPKTTDLNGQAFYLDRVLPRNALNCEKYYVSGRVRKGECGVYYPGRGANFTISYDAQKLPYLGFWVTEGGFRGDYNCALEPSTGYYDSVSIARKNNALSQLAPGEKLNFEISMQLSLFGPGAKM